MGQLSGVMSHIQNDMYIDRELLNNIISSITLFEDYLIIWESELSFNIIQYQIEVDVEEFGISTNVPVVYLTNEDRIANLFVLNHGGFNTTRSGLISRFDNASISSGYNVDHPAEYLQLLGYVGQFYDMFNITLNQKINL